MKYGIFCTSIPPPDDIFLNKFHMESCTFKIVWNNLYFQTFSDRITATASAIKFWFSRIFGHALSAFRPRPISIVYRQNPEKWLFSLMLSFSALGTMVWRYCAYCGIWCHLCDILIGFALVRQDGGRSCKEYLGHVADRWQDHCLWFWHDKLKQRLIADAPSSNIFLNDNLLACLSSPHPGTYPEIYFHWTFRRHHWSGRNLF